MPRFVILWHETEPDCNKPNSSKPHSSKPSHFDLLFEEAADARTWSTEQLTLEHPLQLEIEFTAQEQARHRLFYFDYEGGISGNRGTVTRWDQGTHQPLLSVQDQFEVQLHGTRLTGTLRMHRAGANWICTIAPTEGK